MSLALDPGVIAFLIGISVLYVRAVRVLRTRGYRVPRTQQVWWWLGVALQAVALVGPLDALADDLLSAHMAQHLLLADVAIPFLLAGVRTPVLVFFLPRPVLVALAHRRTLRRLFRFLRRPLAAIPAYVVILYTWHFGFAFEGALRHPALHVLQHVSFVLAGVLIWWAAIEPQRRRLPGELWKIPYIFAARMVSMFLGVAFVVTRTPFYQGFYGSRPGARGVDALADTQIAGGLMMTLDIVVIGGALIFFFWRASQEADRSEHAERTATAAT
ncbi:MAG: cytochrome c oxidase assembly protein [Actinomycetota bacterium]|nr:cytochrome c oxidase assembly protein [Actinomycetota bacterium]